jgi:ubiquinone/menaquinone biosynthesis C-methylase UbiE
MSRVMSAQEKVPGLLGDTPARDYSHKLRLFNEHAKPELEAAIEWLNVSPGMHVLDAGCGTGDVLCLLKDAVGPDGTAVGMDMAGAHVAAARARLPHSSHILQGDILAAPLRESSFDCIWCANTINHLREPLLGVERLTRLLRVDGQIALMQSSFQPEMFFAWDALLERQVQDAVRSYYRHRYGLREEELTGIRSLVGLLRSAGVQDVRTKTFVIERISPLARADEAYLLEAIFRDTWGERLRAHLAPQDYAKVAQLCDPASASYALRREDFHYLQCFTVVCGYRR